MDATQVARANLLRTNEGFLAQRSATIPDNGAPASDASPQSRPASLGQVQIKALIKGGRFARILVVSQIAR